MDKYLIVFIFIIIIIIALFFKDIVEIITLLSIISVLFVGYLLTERLEKFIPDNNAIKQDIFEENSINFNTNDSEISKYGNIYTSEDIDMTRQEIPKGEYGLIGRNNQIDNADVVEEAITRGVSLFHPDGSGFSPLKGIANIPHHFDKYDIPLSGQQDIDEMLSRKQQQRASTNKRALDGSVRATRELYNKYFQ